MSGMHFGHQFFRSLLFIVVVVKKTSLSNLLVTGASSINAGTTSSYTATAAFSDGTSKTVTSSSTWSVSSSAVTISSSSVLTAAQVTTNQAVAVSASYTSGSVTKKASMSVTIVVPVVMSISINSTSQNRANPPASPVMLQPLTTLADYNILADLGMHCGDLDPRVVSILLPFNVLHALQT
jgi:hypothetical protein